MADTPIQRIRRIEITTMIGSAILGGLGLVLGGTPGRMALFLLGVAGGCAVHLVQQAVGVWWRRRRSDG
jgi:hypothetical protein